VRPGSVQGINWIDVFALPLFIDPKPGEHPFFYATKEASHMWKLLDRSKGNVFGFEVGGEITVEEVEQGAALMEKAIQEYGKVSWLVVWKTTHYASLKAMYEDASYLLKNIKNFDRMAIVGDKKWEEILVKADSLVYGEKYFDISQLDEAWDYVEGK
jgi:hypothetical protein